MSRAFELYFTDLVVQAILANDMPARDKLVREKEDVRKEWKEMQKRITTKEKDNV